MPIMVHAQNINITINSPAEDDNLFYSDVNINYTIQGNVSTLNEIWLSIDGVKIKTLGTVGAFITDSNTIALYHMDSGSGTVITDSSGNGYDGNRNGTEFNTTSRFGSYSLAFNGTPSVANDFIQLPKGTQWSPTDFTYEAWIYPRNLTDTHDLYDLVIPNKQIIIRTDDDKLKSELLDNAGADLSAITSNESLVINTWNYIAVTYDSVNDLHRIYIDGRLVGSDSYAHGIPSMDGICYIGVYDNNAGYQEHTYAYDGMIDEMRVSDTVRDPITYFSLTNSSSLENNLIGIYSFDEIGEIKGISIHANESGIIFNSSVINITTDALYEFHLNYTSFLSDWTILLSNTTTNFTDSVTGTTKLLNWSEIPHGNDINFSFQKSGYITTSKLINITNETLTLNETLSTSPSSVWFSFYDEDTEVALNVSKITIANSSETSTYENLTELILAYANIKHGDIIVTLENTSYENRNYYFTIDGLSNITQNLYLLKSSDGAYISFFVYYLDVSGSATPIVDAEVSVAKNFGSGYETVSEQTTDASGTSALFLSQITQYEFTFTATGYDTQTFVIIPSQSQYNIRMNPDVEINITLTHAFENITYGFTPSVLYDNDTAFTFIVSDTGNTLEFYGMNLSFNNSELYFSNITGDANGGSIIATLNLENLTGQYINISAWIKSSSFDDPYFISTIKFVMNSTMLSEDGTVSGALHDAIKGIPSSVRLIIAIFIAMLLVAGMNRGDVGLTGSGLVVIIFLGFMTAVGWFIGIPLWNPLYILMVMTILAIYILGNRW